MAEKSMTVVLIEECPQPLEQLCPLEEMENSAFGMKEDRSLDLRLAEVKTDCEKKRNIQKADKEARQIKVEFIIFTKLAILTMTNYVAGPEELKELSDKQLRELYQKLVAEAPRRVGVACTRGIRIYGGILLSAILTLQLAIGCSINHPILELFFTIFFIIAATFSFVSPLILFWPEEKDFLKSLKKLNQLGINGEDLFVFSCNDSNTIEDF